jgi:hypothetical protein
MPGRAALKAPGAWRRTATLGVPRSGITDSALDQPDQREGGSRTDGEDRPGAEERGDDADHGDQRLAGADLVAAMLAVADRGEMGVVGEPVADLAQCGDDDEGGKHGADAVDFAEDRILECHAERAGDQDRLDAEADRQRQDGGTEH